MATTMTGDTLRRGPRYRTQSVPRVGDPSERGRRSAAATWCAAFPRARKVYRELPAYTISRGRQDGGPLAAMANAVRAADREGARLLLDYLEGVFRGAHVPGTATPEARWAAFDADQREEREATCAVARLFAGDLAAWPEAVKEQAEEVTASQELLAVILAMNGGANG